MVHNIYDLTCMSVKKLQEYLEERYGAEYMYMLTEENPQRILDNRRLVGYEPIPFDEDR